MKILGYLEITFLGFTTNTPVIFKHPFNINSNELVKKVMLGDLYSNSLPLTLDESTVF